MAFVHQDLASFVKPLKNDRLSIEFALEGVSTPQCIRLIEEGLGGLAGIIEARLNYTTHRVRVVWQSDTTTAAALAEKLEELGYRAHPFLTRSQESEENRRARWLLLCLGVAAFASMNIMLMSVSVWAGNVSDIDGTTRDFFHWISAVIAIPTVAMAGQPFFLGALEGWRQKRWNMDAPIAIALLLTIGISLWETAHSAENAYFDSVVMLLFFLLCGRYLDQAMRRETRSVAGNLAAKKALFVSRIESDGSMIQVPTSVIHVGDHILVRAGDTIGVDGLIVSGRSTLDDSLLSGETFPKSVCEGDHVYAGCLNQSGTLTVLVEAAGENTFLDDIQRLLDQAVDAKSRYIQLADRAAGFYAPIVHGVALITIVAWLLSGASLHQAILVAATVLIITCPCALALAVPVVQVVSAGTLFRNLILLNNASTVERLADIDTVVFDKTGTLTLPEPTISNSDTINPTLLDYATRLALSSHHPLALVVARSGQNKVPFEHVQEVPGQGVCVTLNDKELRLGSAPFCGVDEAVLAETFHISSQISSLASSYVHISYGDQRATLIIQQQLRSHALSVVQNLKALGLKIIILSGDHNQAVEETAKQLDIENWVAACKPDAKIAYLEDLKQQGYKVLMVGDGLNDAPALAGAHVSLSPISASDLAQVQADAVFLGESLKPVEQAYRIAKKARRLMRQNLILALVYNCLAVPLAFLGYVTPLIAALAMSGSSLIVTLNGLRARFMK